MFRFLASLGRGMVVALLYVVVGPIDFKNEKNWDGRIHSHDHVARRQRVRVSTELVSYY